MNSLTTTPSLLQLPVLHVEVTGKVTASNLDAYRAAALELFNGINTTLSTDEDFAGADRAVKWCGDVEDKLVLAKKRTLEQTADINAILTTLDEIGEQARQKRLQLEKLIKSRKELVKQEIVDAARKALSNHMDAMNASLKMGFTLPGIPVNFVDAIKNKRTFSGIQEAVNAELTRATSQATTIANTMRSNTKAFDELSEDANYAHLFRDMASLLTKEPESFVAVVKQRIADELERKRLVAEQAAETVRVLQRKIQEDEAEAQMLAQAEASPDAEPTAASEVAEDDLMAKIEARAAEIEAERGQKQGAFEEEAHAEAIRTNVTIAIGCTQRFDLTISGQLVELLTKLGSIHYDGVCKSAAKHGGFVYGWSNQLDFAKEQGEHEITVSATNGQLQTCLKIMEFPPSSLLSEEQALQRNFTSIGFAALRQANRDERFTTTIPVTNTIGITA